MADALSGNRAIEDAAIAWVMELERLAGRSPVDRRSAATFPADLESKPRVIEIKAFGGSSRGFDLWLEVNQVEEARRNPDFWLYLVENVRQGDASRFALRALGGSQLARILARAREKRYFEVPLPVAEYHAAPGPEALASSIDVVIPHKEPPRSHSDPEWWSVLALSDRPHVESFGGLDVWVGWTSFRRWPRDEPSAHELNCRKGRGLLLGPDGEFSCAEIEVARAFRQAGWKAGWLATCGRRNARWREFMVAATAPKSSILEVPVPLVPGRVASLIVRHGTSGYPDVVAWQSERRPVFVELKGPGDGGAGQVGWLKRAFDSGPTAVEDFLLLRWTAS